MVGITTWVLLEIYLAFQQWKNFENPIRIDKVIAMSLVCSFFGPPCIELCLQWRTNRKSCMIYRMAPFSMTLNDSYPRFQGYTIFDAEYLRNGAIYRHDFNGILIGTYTCPTQQCRFGWPWVILSVLAKYSVDKKRHAVCVTAELLVFRWLKEGSWLCCHSFRCFVMSLLFLIFIF